MSSSSVTRISLSFPGLQSPAARDESTLSHDETKQVLRVLADANARCHLDAPDTVVIFPDPQTSRRVREVAAVVPGAGNAKRLRQFPRPVRQQWKIPGLFDLDPASPCHLFDPGQRLQSSEQNASCTPLPLARDVQAIVITVNKVDVSVARRPEQYCIPQGLTGSRMGRKVFLAQVGLDFHNPAGESPLRRLTYQDFSQKFTRDPPGRSGIERALEDLDFRRRHKESR